MIRSSLIVFLGLSLAAPVTFADIAPQPAPAAYEPVVGQKGKDVVWVPTPQALVDRMLDMAKVTPADFVMDLGSGDGRTVITAAKRGIRALGVEYDENMVELSTRNALKEGVADRARFVKADLFTTDLSPATVITMFLLPEINLKLRPALLELKPGTRIVSNTFTMADWNPDERADLSSGSGCDGSWCTALLWIVPAKVAGRHATAHGDLELEQEFQNLKGTLRNAGKAIPIEGKVRGEEVVLYAGARQLRGRMDGRRLALE